LSLFSSDFKYLVKISFGHLTAVEITNLIIFSFYL
jgi:hypothetical protein